MTLPVSGPISLNAVNVELQLSGTTTISLNQSNVRTLAGVPSGAISMSNLYGKAYTVPGNSGILTSGTSFTLPSTSGLTIKILVIGGGGGGGGGSGRTSFSGFFTGGGGGGAGAIAYAEASVTPGQSITYQVGSGGTAGVARDGVFTSGSNGGSGTTSFVSINGVTVAQATGGVGGVVSPNATGGAGGTVTAGSTAVYVGPSGSVTLNAVAGGTAGSGTTSGGIGAEGYQFTSTAVGASPNPSYGYAGATYPEGVVNVPNTPGGVWGGGGSGGSCAQSDVYIPSLNINPNAGGTGAVFIWWGY